MRSFGRLRISDVQCSFRALSSKSTSSPTNTGVRISIFFSDCEVLKKNHDLLSSVGFQIVQPPKAMESSSVLYDFQSSRLSSGGVMLEFISDPVLTKLRKLLGRKRTFARLLEIQTSNNFCEYQQKTFYPLQSGLFSRLYPFTALSAAFPYFVPVLSMDSSTVKVATSDSNLVKSGHTAYFDHVKEIIIPCSAANQKTIEDAQLQLENISGISPINRNLPGLYQIDLPSSQKLVLRTAPTDACTVILKVPELGTASRSLKSLNALGDSMGRGGASQHGQVQIQMSGLYGGLEFRITDTDVVSPFYAEPPQSVVADTVPEMQSPRVLMEGGRDGTEKEIALPIVKGDCWKEVRVQLRNSTK